ncbi:MAG TPA: LPXTG cell wall anchor domain-containing protein [Acidimicrobiales bacterium]|nr:LPXTG cell wall anchor domain-containing protein [Acidimicrobiales bacterium]
MDIRRMMGIAALGAAATTLVVVPGAGAQEPETYSGSSTGEALGLSVLGQGLTLGTTLAEVSSAPGATAQGFGVATPLFEAGATSAAVEGSGEDGSTEQVCEGPIDQVPGLSILLACSSSVASVTDGAPRSAATGRVGAITLNPVDPLLETPLSEVVAPVQDGLDQLLTALQPVTGPVGEGTGIDLDSSLRELLDALFSGADLVKVTIGDTESSTTVDAESVATECAADGARIDVLDAAPVAGVDAPPVISIIVGEASTSVVADRAGGEPTAEVNPSLVTIRSALLPGGEVAVEIGQAIEIPLPEPLGTSVIGVAAGTTDVGEDGRTTATASAVTVDLLNGEALQGGIELDLAACSSVAGATPAQLPQAPAPTQPTLPTTGTDGPNTLALAATVGLAGLGLALLRRTRTAE